jgi:hypothetical protein
MERPGIRVARSSGSVERAADPIGIVTIRNDAR